ncbi:MAG: hypothetical protein KGJ13_08340 [Patescibacteria group bacterium]|nr:hypothetical protein [Patescibacteria group bacterium]
MIQHDLFSGTLDERFRNFHERNPAVYDLFRKFAERAHQAGARRIGAKAIAERIRWETSVEKVGDYKINNSYVSRYARLLIAAHPHLGDLFEVRSLKS